MIQRLDETGDVSLPALPPPNPSGNRPARSAMIAMIARKLVRRRAAIGITQAQLAQRAGVRPETISRIEGGKHRPQRATLLKIDAALDEAAA